MIAVAVGSNIRPVQNILRGLRMLDVEAPLVACSPFWRTPPIGRPEQDPYVNGVVAVRTTLPPERLQGLLRRVEAACGRVRSEDRYAARTLDLDLVLYDDLVRAGPGLRLPDPDILARSFLAAGLLALAPGLVLPGGVRPEPPPPPGPVVPGLGMEAIRSRP